MASGIQNHAIDIDTSDEPNASIKNNDISRGSFSKLRRVSPDPTGDDGTQPATEGSGKNRQKNKKNSKMTILVLLQVLVLLLILGFLAASLVVRVLKNRFPGGLEIWKWCLFALSVLCGFALVLWAYWPVMFLVEQAFTLKQDVIYFVYGLRKSGAFFIWWVWVLVMWLILMEQQIKEASPRADKVLRIATRTIISLAVASFGWILVTIGLRLLSLKCRFNRYLNKVQLAAIHFDIVRALAQKPIEQRKNGCNWFCMNKSIGEALANHEIARFNTFKSEKLSFLNWDYFFDHETQDLEFTTFKGKTNVSTDEDAREIGLFIFDNVVNNIRPKPEFLDIIDKGQLVHFLTEEQIKILVKLLKAEESHSIDRDAFTNWVIKVYQDRKTLIQALGDNRSATKRLTTLMRIALVIVSIIAWLLWIDVLTTKLLAAFLTSLAGGVFIFGEAVKMTFQSIIFVFVVHPFDIGDECLIEGIPMVVEQMDITTTTFLNKNKEKTYYPNYVLSTKVISNTTRSSLLNDTVPFCIDMKTPVETIAALKDTIIHDMESSSVIVEGFENEENIKMSLQFSYKNLQENNGDKIINPRTAIIDQLTSILDSKNITYSFPLKEDAELCDDFKNRTRSGSGSSNN